MSRRKRPRRSKRPDVALGDEVVREELPFPFVHYTSRGAFIAFSETAESVPRLCECALGALENYLTLIELPAKIKDKHSRIKKDFPPGLLSDPVTSSTFHLKTKLCHRCNDATPTLRYCLPMYGGKFKQSYGWYINQAAYRLGVDPCNYSAYLTDVCADEVIKDILEAQRIEQAHVKEYERLQKMVWGPKRSDIAPSEITFWGNVKLEEAETYVRLRRQSNQAFRKISKRYENMAREDFGFRKVGEAWVSESMLGKILSRLLGPREVKRHFRPPWLDGLELDFYIPELRLGVEYQGQQHFRPVKAWGGQEALDALRERDALKVELCKKENVRLLHIDFTEPLIESHIASRLSELAESLD